MINCHPSPFLAAAAPALMPPARITQITAPKEYLNRCGPLAVYEPCRVAHSCNGKELRMVGFVEVIMIVVLGDYNSFITVLWGDYNVSKW